MAVFYNQFFYFICIISYLLNQNGEKMKKISLSAIVAISILSACTNASANEVGVSFQLTGTSNYMLRGLSLSNDKAAVFGDITIGYGNFFGGIWASNVEFEGVTDTDAEIDFYAGYANSFYDLSVSAVYARYTYGSELVDDSDDLKFDISYPFGKVTLGGKYEIATWNENDEAEKNDYVEGYVGYDFGVATATVSVGSWENTGDNYMLALSKSGKFAEQDVEFKVRYVRFNSEDETVNPDDDTLFADVIFSF